MHVRHLLFVAWAWSCAAVSGAAEITAVQPALLSTAGGQRVAFIGTEFRSGLLMSFANRTASSAITGPTFIDATRYEGTTAPVVAGVYDAVLRSVTGGEVARLVGAVTIAPPPLVSGVTPNQVSTLGGTAVTVGGRGFMPQTVISFGTHRLVSQRYISETEITGIAPALDPREAPGPKSVFAEDTRGRDELRDGVTYVVPQPASLRAVEPNQIPETGGIPVAVTGARFQADTVIAFGGHKLVSPTFVSESRITGIAPALAFGEPLGPKDVSASDARGSDVLKGGVTYIFDGPPPPSPAQIESVLAEGVASFEWYNPVPYAQILVFDEQGALLRELPGDTTTLDLPSEGSDRVKIGLQGVTFKEKFSGLAQGLAALQQCDQPSPLTGRVFVGELEFSVYGDHPPAGGKGGGLDACLKGPWPQPQDSVGYVVPQIAQIIGLDWRKLTTGFTLQQPSAKLEIAGYYQKVAVAFGLDLRGHLKRVYPAEDFALEFSFPDMRMDLPKDWNGKLVFRDGGEPIPEGEYLLDLYAVGGDRKLPYYVFADDARDDELLIPGSPCPPYPMVTVKDLTGMRTLPEITGVEQVWAQEIDVAPGISFIFVCLRALGTWSDANDEIHSITPGDPTYIENPYVEYEWTIYDQDPPRTVPSGTDSFIITTIADWSCFDIDIQVMDKQCGTTRKATTEVPVIPPGVTCNNNWTSFLFATPNTSDVFAVLGLSPEPGHGTFQGERPVKFKFLAVPKCFCDDPDDCPAPQLPNLDFRLFAPVSNVVLAKKGDPVFQVKDRCENIVEGAKYYEISIDDIGKLAAALTVEPNEFEVVKFQGKTLSPAGDVWRDICTIPLCNYPSSLADSHWTGYFEEKDASYHFVVKPGPSSQVPFAVGASNQIDVPDLPVSIPPMDNDLSSGFVSRMMMQGGYWDPETGTGTNSGQILSNGLDGAPAQVAPKVSTDAKGFPKFTWCERLTIFENQFSQTLFEAVLYTGTIGPVPVTVWASVGLGLDFLVETQVQATVAPFAAIEGGNYVSTDFFLLSSVDISIPCEIRADILFGIASLIARLIPEANFTLDTQAGTRDISFFADLYLRATISLAFELKVCISYIIDEVCFGPPKVWLFKDVDIIPPQGSPLDPGGCGKDALAEPPPPPDIAAKDGEPGPYSMYVTTSAPTTVISPDGETTIDAWVEDDGFARVYVNGAPNTLPGGTDMLGHYRDPAAAFLSDTTALIAWTQYVPSESGLTLPIAHPTLEQRNLLAASEEIMVVPVTKEPMGWELGSGRRVTDDPAVTPFADRRVDGRPTIAADLMAEEAIVAWIRYETPEFLHQDGMKSVATPEPQANAKFPNRFPLRLVPNIQPQLNLTAIYAQRVGLTGTIGLPVKISPTGINIEPVIAASPSADFMYCVWIHDPTHETLIESNLGRNIYCAYYEKATGQWSPAAAVIAAPDDYPAMLEPYIAIKDGRNGLLAFTALVKGSTALDTGLGGGSRYVYGCRLIDGVFGEPFLIHKKCQPREYGHWISLGVPPEEAMDPTSKLKWKNPEWVMCWERSGPLGSSTCAGGVMVAVFGEGMDVASPAVNLTDDGNIHSNKAMAVSGSTLRFVNANQGPASMRKRAGRKFAPLFETGAATLHADPAITGCALTDQFGPAGTPLSAFITVRNIGFAGTPLTKDGVSALGLRVTFIDDLGNERTVAQLTVPELAPAEDVRLEVPLEMPRSPVRLRAVLDPDPVDRVADNNSCETYLGAPAPTDFACETVVRRDGSKGTACRLTWQNPVAYDEIYLYRDKAMFASLSGRSKSYVDFKGTGATHEYAVRGRVSASKSVRATCTFTVRNEPPVAVITIPELDWRCESADPCTLPVCLGQRTTLQAGASYDPGRGQKIAQYEWDLDGDGQYDDGTDAEVPVTWDRAGTYEIGLRVTDDFAGGPLSAIQRARLVVAPCETRFVRGNVNGDRRLDIADAITILGYLFAHATAPECLKSADANDDGNTNIADAIYLLSHLFARGSPPPMPYPECGTDPTSDKLTCERYAQCR